MFASFDDLVNKLSPQRGAFTVHVECSSGRPPEASFREVLDIEDAELNEYGVMLSDWTKIEHETRKYLAKLHWLIRALVQFQDVLPLIPHEGLPPLEKLKHSDDLVDTLCRHHCYYEALVHLRSGVLSLVNANTHATISVLRPIVEQFVYFVYWNIVQGEGGIGKYNTWLRTGKGKPPFKNATEKVESVLKSRRSLISKRVLGVMTAIRGLYQAQCSWSHTPAAGESFRTGGLAPIQGSFADWVFCVHMYNAALLSILRLYVYQYPMSLFPINLIRKWGWKMPIGVFVDECSGGIIEEALGKHEADKLREVLLKDQEVSEKLQHTSTFPALTDDAIWGTWHTSQDKKDGLQCPKDIPSMAAQLKGVVRSAAWAFNYLPQLDMEEGITIEEEKSLREFYGE
jgi:hypothetical protein